MRKYTRNELWGHAFTAAWSEFYTLVGSNGNPIEGRESDFDYSALSEAEKDMYDKEYDGCYETLKEQYERETGETYY